MTLKSSKRPTTVTLLKSCKYCIHLSRKWFLSLFLFVCLFLTLTYDMTSPLSALYQLCDTSINCVYVWFVIFSVTLAEDGARRCLNPVGRKAKFFVNCWNRINKDDKQKRRCLKRKAE
uniref:C-X-C motif chemokine 11-like n=1 Tax=Oncorhynchus kisutch TaxID=8019 RepID=A0A8C7KAV7_ONCKI